ncbi:MAG TPA: ATP-binding SpoIIE family protein phosphatase [Candidatus Binatia bacterium]|nr:ATP-binding SpoIIE family protein phosphatase [Candidatus Binatia bacterium]
MHDDIPGERFLDSSTPHTQVCLAVTEASQVAEARRCATALAQRAGFNETDTGKVALVVTELATNLVKHATRGALVLRVVPPPDADGIEALALDTAPGVANFAACLRDGYSTAGSPGTGLGAIVRLSSQCEIYSLPGKGTAVLARLRPQGARATQAPAARRPPATVGAVCLPCAGETACGDAWAIDQRAGRILVMVADGLGHGLRAAEAAREAVRVFQARPTLAPAALLEVIHTALRGTRGAAVAVAEIDLTQQAVSFAGVGNIAGTVLTPTGRYGLASHGGIVGHTVPKIQAFTHPRIDMSLLVMHSDGLLSRWDLDAYPGLVSRHPGLIAGVLYRDYARGRDDVTVVAVKTPAPQP